MHGFIASAWVLGFALAGCATLAAPERHIVKVLISLDGATAQTVERTVAMPIEDALSRLEGVKQVHSTSRHGVCAFEVDVIGKDAAGALAQVDAQVLAAWRRLGAPASRPVVVLKVAETAPAPGSPWPLLPPEAP